MARRPMGITLFRAFGLPVRANPSWLILVALALGIRWFSKRRRVAVT